MSRTSPVALVMVGAAPPLGCRNPAGYASRRPGAQQQGGAEQTAEQRAGEDAGLGQAGQPGGREGELSDEQRHGEPDPGQGREPDDVSGREALGQPADPQADGCQAAHGDPEDLAADQTQGDAPGDRAGGRRPQCPGAQRETGVGQREQRHDEVAGDRVQAALELLQHGTAADRAGRGGQAEDDPGDGGVDAGLQRRQPHQQAERQIRGDLGHAEPAQAEDGRQAGGGDGEPTEREAGGVRTPRRW
jgi:transcription termination factor Rho